MCFGSHSSSSLDSSAARPAYGPKVKTTVLDLTYLDERILAPMLDRIFGQGGWKAEVRPFQQWLKQPRTYQHGC